jgi:ATP-binding cassette subfamily B protein
VTEALERLAAGRTTFLITHDLRQVERANRIVYLQDGRALEQGSHADLLRSGGRYATLYHLGAALQDVDPTTPHHLRS